MLRPRPSLRSIHPRFRFRSLQLPVLLISAISYIARPPHCLINIACARLTMPFNRPNPPPPLSMDDKYLNQPLSPMSRPMDPFSVNKAPGVEPLNGNWSYDSAIDLFSLTPADMDPMSFDFADGLANTDTKDQFMDPFGSSNTINGFAMPAAEDSVSLSSVRRPPSQPANPT